MCRMSPRTLPSRRLRLPSNCRLRLGMPPDRCLPPLVPSCFPLWLLVLLLPLLPPSPLPLLRRLPPLRPRLRLRPRLVRSFRPGNG